MSSPRTSEEAVSAPYGPTTIALCAVGVLVVGQLYVVLPLLSDLASAWGTSRAAITWTTTAFGLAYGAGFLVTGPLSDAHGRRPVIVIGLLLTALTTLAVTAASTLTMGIGLRVVQGATASFFAPAALSYLAERIAPERRLAALTWLTSSFLAAGVIGQVYGDAVSSVLGWRAVFVFGAGGFVVAAFILGRLLAPGERAPTAGPREIAGRFTRLLGSPQLVLMYLGCLAILGVFVALYTGIQLHPPRDLGDSPAALLTLRASALPAMVAVPLLAGRLAAVDPVRRLSLALLAAAVAAVASVFPLGALWLGGVLMIFVAAVAIAAPAAVQAIGASAGSARGTATALYTFALFVGASAGPQVANAFSRWGYPGVALAAATWALLAAALAWTASVISQR